MKVALKPSFLLQLRSFFCTIRIHEKLLKKCRKLEGIVVKLKACLEPTEMPSKGGIHTVCACRTHLVVHKVAALKRMMERFDAYVSGLIAMTEDSSVKPADKKKMKACVKR